MGASLYRLEYKLIGNMGRAEANWLMNHVGASDERPNTISLQRENIEEYLNNAATCEGCEFFNDGNQGLKLHAEVTKDMKDMLTKLFDEAKDDYVDVEISW